MPDKAFVPVLHGAAGDRPDEADTVIAAEAIAAALSRLGYWTEIIHVGIDFAGIEELANRNPMSIFNLIEAINGDAGLAHIPPALFEHYSLIYTGADASTWRSVHSKLDVKERLAAAGLPTPAWSRDGNGLQDLGRVIVKSPVEHASVGIDADSVVPSELAAREIAAREIRFRGPFSAESYVDGREFNISLLEGQGGPVVLPVAEIIFVDFPPDRPRIVDYDAKWIEDSAAYKSTPRCFDFQSSDTPLLAKLRDLSIKVWRLFGLRGYARVDFRVDAAGRPWILEINVNPCLTPEAGFTAAAAQAGYSFDDIVQRIVDVSVSHERLAV